VLNVKRSFLLSTLALAIPLFAFAQPAPAPSPPEIEVIPQPESAKALEFKGEVGVPLTLSLKGGEKARWKLIDSAAAAIVPCESGKRCTFVARAEGKFRLTAIAGEKDIDVVVIVGTPAPPTPPTPPVPPSPVDPLIVALQAAYTANTEPTKAGQLAALAALYDAAVDLVKGANPPATTADLIGRLRQSAEVLKVSGLEGMRKIIATELKSVLPNDGPLTGDAKIAATAVLVRVRDALTKVK
jgi:hypothetical protein